MTSIANMSVSDQVVHTTARIDTLKGGTPLGNGTGFFFDFAEEGERFTPALVTNKHVLEGADEVRLNFSVIVNGLRKTQSGSITELDKTFVFHPNPSIDLCAAPLSLMMQGFSLLGEELCQAFVGFRNIPSDADIAAMSAIESALMVGYPVALIDSVNNLPIVRRGITATPYAYDFQGRPDFLLDIACYPGSSGSPVYVLDEGVYAGKNGIIVSEGAARFLFIGIVKENTSMVKEVPIAGRANETVRVEDAINIAHVIKARELKRMKQLVFEKSLSMAAK